MLRFGSVRLELPAVFFGDVPGGAVRLGAATHLSLPTSHPSATMGGGWGRSGWEGESRAQVGDEVGGGRGRGGKEWEMRWEDFGLGLVPSQMLRFGAVRYDIR